MALSTARLNSTYQHLTGEIIRICIGTDAPCDRQGVKSYQYHFIPLQSAYHRGRYFGPQDFSVEAPSSVPEQKATMDHMIHQSIHNTGVSQLYCFCSMSYMLDNHESFWESPTASYHSWVRYLSRSIPRSYMQVQVYSCVEAFVTVDNCRQLSTTVDTSTSLVNEYCTVRQTTCRTVVIPERITLPL